MPVHLPLSIRVHVAEWRPNAGAFDKARVFFGEAVTVLARSTTTHAELPGFIGDVRTDRLTA